jgi:cold shock CspA family protein
VLFALTSDQTLLLAEQLDGLLADEEDELHPPACSGTGCSTGACRAAERGAGEPWDGEVVQPHQRLGFVTPDDGGEEIFLHRSVLEQAGSSDLAEGTRVRVQTSDGKKGPQASALALA